MLNSHQAGAGALAQNLATGKVPARRWRFGGVELDERSLILNVDGRTVEIEPKPLRVLLHLLDRAGEVVTKDALMRAVWPGRIITDAALAKSVARLRDAIGDRDQAFIRTHHGFGYQMVAPISVEVLERQSPAPPTPRVLLREDPGPAAIRPPLRRDTERRLLTVLFCGLVGHPAAAHPHRRPHRVRRRRPQQSGLLAE
ncbi:MAG: winged helix-turn-helix domain-containing protein [Panacagrimonas sp.]